MRSPVRQKWIESWNLEYDYGFIQIKKIDRTKSLENQARMGQPLIPETLTRYIEAKKSGIEFPAITIYLSSNTGKYVVIDGNHRMHATSAIGEDTIDAYIVTVDDAFIIEMMTRSANIQMGHPPSFAEAKEHAKIAVVRLGVNRDEVAKRFGISRSVLDTALRVDEVDLVLTSLNLDPERLPLTSRDILNQTKDNHPLLQGVFNLAIDANLSSAEIKEVVHNIKREHNEKDRLALLENYAKSGGIETRIKGVSPRRKESTKIWGMLTTILRLEKASIVEYGITSTADLVKFQDRALQSITILNRLLTSAEEALP